MSIDHMAVDARALPAEHIAGRILLIRGHKVLLDADLAVLYGVPTKVLVQAVKLHELERKLKGQDQAIAGILDAIRQLLAPPALPKKRPIGFVTGEEK